jgi:pyroglutamyl-peptidase
MIKTVLLTGFDAFDNEPVNPSWEAVRALDGVRMDTPDGAAVIVARQLPTVFGAASEALVAAIGEVQPALVIAVGQAGGRPELSIERVAINIDDARIEDNAGKQPVDTPIVVGGPTAYFATLPIKAIVHALRDAGVPASVSQTAGTFVCNHVFYALCHYIATRAPRLLGGFVHIPYLPEQAVRHPGQPSLALPMVVDGLKLVVRTALSVRQDVRESGGALH